MSKRPHLRHLKGLVMTLSSLLAAILTHIIKLYCFGINLNLFIFKWHCLPSKASNFQVYFKVKMIRVSLISLKVFKILVKLYFPSLFIDSDRQIVLDLQQDSDGLFGNQPFRSLFQTAKKRRTLAPLQRPLNDLRNKEHAALSDF